MSRSEENGQREEDPFWEIALNYDGRGKVFDNFSDDKHENDGSGGDTDPEGDHMLGGKAKTYHLPNCSISLELAPLASDDGIWSPVGDHAWYSSALLTCLILQGTSMMNGKEDLEDSGKEEEKGRNDISRLSGGLGLDEFGLGKDLRILELGSGAIGLPGISFAAALSQRQERFPSWTVILTDNDKSLLKRLEANVRSNVNSNKILLSNNGDRIESLENRNINVEYLEWDLERNDSDNNEDGNDKIIESKSTHDRLLSADIVIGSELVYTRETAIALVKVLFSLLDRNPAVKIWIVQVTDRYGWKEIVIPALESEKNISIENIPLTYDIHEVASTMIPMGGALDRYAFGAFCISNTIPIPNQFDTLERQKI